MSNAEWIYIVSYQYLLYKRMYICVQLLLSEYILKLKVLIKKWKLQGVLKDFSRIHVHVWYFVF